MIDKSDIDKVTKRFADKTTQDPTTGCSLWTAYAASSGHGRFGIGRNVYWAHRVSWEIYRGPIPDGLCVCHKCDTPACVNPDHLFLGTQKDNLDDMTKKGRDRKAVGSENGRSKLNSERVAEIKARIVNGDMLKDIAFDHGVDKSTVSQIKRGLIWKE